MAHHNRGGFPYQKMVGSSGPPPAQQPAYPIQSNVGAYPRQAYHQSPYNQQYPQPYLHANPQPGPYPQPYGQPNYGQAPPTYPGMAPQPGVPQPMIHGQFDSGARFGAGATVTIPPPPPGVMPTHAQVAAARGQPVAMQQPKAGWIEGASGGGYTVW